MFATAGGVPELLIARVIQGLATGAALGAIGAGLLDVDRERGTFANSLCPGHRHRVRRAAVRPGRCATCPTPRTSSTWPLPGVIVLQAAGVALMRETVTRKPGALASLRPEIRLPRALRGPVLTAVPVLFAVWSLAGLYAALGPSLVHALTGSGDVVLGGLSLFILTLTAVLAITVLRGAAGRTVMLTGILALIAGVAVTMLALGIASTRCSSSASAISGVGFGSGFQGSIRDRGPPGRGPRARGSPVLAVHRRPTWAWVFRPWRLDSSSCTALGLTDTALYYGWRGHPARRAGPARAARAPRTRAAGRPAARAGQPAWRPLPVSGRSDKLDRVV